MAKKGTGFAGIFDEPESGMPALPVDRDPSQNDEGAVDAGRVVTTRPTRKISHPGKKPVLIHIPEDMHRTLRQLSVEDGGEPLTKITERALRQYLVQRGHTKYAQ